MIKISIVQSDITEVDADVLVLKFARQFHGADEVVALRLFQSGVCNANRMTTGDFSPTGIQLSQIASDAKFVCR